MRATAPSATAVLGGQGPATDPLSVPWRTVQEPVPRGDRPDARPRLLKVWLPPVPGRPERTH